MVERSTGTLMKLLVANRGEIAIRIIRAGAELGIPTVAVYPQDDAGSLHTGKADEALAIRGAGTTAYLDIERIIGAAKNSGCDAIHPGYGFLAENAKFAQRCLEEGITFVGPTVELLLLFGDKARARTAAATAGVPILRGLDHAVSVDEAKSFLAELGPNRAMMIKAVAGGGGRGSRLVEDADEIDATYDKCRSEAEAAFGSGDVYVEEFIQQARHIEVQILGDGKGGIAHLGERECSAQRRFQKLIEVAPAPCLNDKLRRKIIDAAVRLANKVNYTNAGTFEFLVDCSSSDQRFAFIEANARLQVEHTVTEEVTGVDLVKAQLRLTQGSTIADLGLAEEQAPRGYAIQARVCMERVREDGSIHPTTGTLSAYEAPSGLGIRTDGFGYNGYETSLLYDSLLAKVIGHSPSPDFADTIARTSRALSEFRIEGVETNIQFLQSILEQPEFASGSLHTRFVDQELHRLATQSSVDRPRYVTPVGAGPRSGAVGGEEDADRPVGPDGSVGLPSPIQGTIVAIDVAVGQEVRKGQTVAVVEAMKLQHDIQADQSGVVCEISMSVGDIVKEGYPIVFIHESEIEGGEIESSASDELDQLRGDMQELNNRIAENLDAMHAEAVAARHADGRRTARENIADLLDDGSFREFGPATSGSIDGGSVIGFGSVNADLFGEERSRVALIHNDISTTTTTNGAGHYKQEPVHELVHDFQVPLVIFSEGEGKPYVGPQGFQLGVGMDTQLYSEFAKLSGLVPLVGITTGQCFGPNATLLACCDVIIATRTATIGMGGGPAVVEATGMGKFTPEEIGSMSFQVENGNVDILVEDDAAAVRTAKQYLSYFQGNVGHWEAPDQRRMRHIIPENRVRTVRHARDHEYRCR